MTDASFVEGEGPSATRLLYREAGSGEPVVLLHGLPDTLATWDEHRLPFLARPGPGR